jgi:hypothetical protein
MFLWLSCCVSTSQIFNQLSLLLSPLAGGLPMSFSVSLLSPTPVQLSGYRQRHSVEFASLNLHETHAACEKFEMFLGGDLSVNYC